MRHKKFTIFCIALISTLLTVGLASCDWDKNKTDDTVQFHLESLSSTSSFFMENADENLIVEAIIPEGQESDEIVWSLSTKDASGNTIDKSNTIMLLKSNKVFISMKSLSYLGDYELKGTIGEQSATYNFSLNSTKELENALVYSFVPIEKLDDDSNSEFVEYSLLGKRLNSPSDRAILGKSISYSPSISSLLYITGETERLGELDTGESTDFYISKTSDKGIFLQPKDSNLTSTSLSIYAGSKKKKDISINLLKSSPLDIKSPIISKERPHEKSGVVLSITADNVSTEYNSFDDGYSLDISVKRSINDSEKTLILPTITKTENEWKTTESECYITAIEYGYDVYLPFEGEYEIEAKTVTITGESESTLYSFTVDPSNTKDSITFDITPSVKNNSWLTESLPSLNAYGKYEYPPLTKATIRIPGGTSGNYLLFASYISYDGTNDSYEKVREVIKSGSTLSFSKSGKYDIYITREDAGNKIGNFKDDEYKNSESVFHSSFNIIKYDGIDSVDIIGKVTLTQDAYNYEFTLKDDNDIVKNFTIYARLLQRSNGEYSPITTSKGLFYSNKDSVLELGETYKITFKHTEVKTEDDVKLAIYLLPKNSLTVNPKIKLLPQEYNKNFSYNDAVPKITVYYDSQQDKFNTRKYKIINVKDESGKYKKVAYTFQTDASGNPINWSPYISLSQFDIYTPSTQNPTVHIKATNYNETHTVYMDQPLYFTSAGSIRKKGEIFGTYGRHGAPYKNEMFKLRKTASYENIYIFECFRKSDNYVLERLYLFYDKALNKWRVHKINRDNTEEFYDATIEDGWWIAKNYHQLFIYKTDQYCGFYKACKGYLYGKIAYSYPIFEGNEDNDKYCSVYKYLEKLDNYKIVNEYTDLPRIEPIKEWT